MSSYLGWCVSQRGWCVVTIVVGLPLCWWFVPVWFEQSPVVEPVDVFEGGVLDLVTVTPWGLFVDEFCFV